HNNFFKNLGVDLELSTVAMTYVYFEKLVLKNFVNKPNRRLVAGICLFLASKTNEPRGMTFGPLLQSIDKYFDVDEKEIKEHEFSVFVALGFQLYLPKEEFMPHFDRIFQSLGK
ncbi:1533_t:CDS:2, partial [Paraglomus occultum]